MGILLKMKSQHKREKKMLGRAFRKRETGEGQAGDQKSTAADKDEVVEKMYFAIKIQVILILKNPGAKEWEDNL